MLNNKIIENELNDLEKEINDLLARISELKKEVHEMIDKKIIYEQHISVSNDVYTMHSKINENTLVRNIVKSHIDFNKKNPNLLIGDKPGIYEWIAIDRKFILSEKNKKIIETYIPSQNICLVVEL